jgi:hypothetical protein
MTKVHGFCNAVGVTTNRWLSFSSADGSPTSERSIPATVTCSNAIVTVYILSNSLDGACVVNLIQDGSSVIATYSIPSGQTGVRQGSPASGLTISGGVSRLGLRADMTGSSTGTILFSALGEAW